MSWLAVNLDQRLRHLVEHRSRSNQRVVGFVLGGVEADRVRSRRICSHKCQSPQLNSNSSRGKRGEMELTDYVWVRPIFVRPLRQNFWAVFPISDSFHGFRPVGEVPYHDGVGRHHRERGCGWRVSAVLVTVVALRWYAVVTARVGVAAVAVTVVDFD